MGKDYIYKDYWDSIALPFLNQRGFKGYFFILFNHSFSQNFYSFIVGFHPNAKMPDCERWQDV